MINADRDDSTGSTAEAMQPWERNRKLRQAQIEAKNERGRQLLERYGGGQPRPRFANVGHVTAKRRRLRR